MEKLTMNRPKSITGMPDAQRDPMNKLLWTVADLQQVIGCGRARVYALVNMQGFPAIRMAGGKRIYIPRDGFLKWLEQQTEAVTGAN